MSKPAPTRDAVLTLLRAVAPKGMTKMEIVAITGQHPKAFQSMAFSTAKRGLIHLRDFGRAAYYFANKADAEAMTADEIPGREFSAKTAPQQWAVAEVARAHRLGATQAQLVAGTGIAGPLVLATITAMRPLGRIFSIGTPCHLRYFADEATMRAAEAEVLQEIAAERKQAKELKKAKKRAWHNEKRAPMLKAKRLAERQASPPKEPKPARPPKEPKPPKLAKPPKEVKVRPPKPPKAAKPTHSEFAAATFAKRTAPKPPPKPSGPIVIPPHVKVQVCPGFTRSRFEVTEAPRLFSLVGIGRDVNTGRAWGQP